MCTHKVKLGEKKRQQKPSSKKSFTALVIVAVVWKLHYTTHTLAQTHTHTHTHNDVPLHHHHNQPSMHKVTCLINWKFNIFHRKISLLMLVWLPFVVVTLVGDVFLFIIFCFYFVTPLIWIITFFSYVPSALQSFFYFVVALFSSHSMRDCCFTVIYMHKDYMPVRSFLCVCEITKSTQKA